MDKNLQEELKQYKKEKEQIRELLGKIGGKVSSRNDKVITIVFSCALILLFIIDTARHLLRIHIPFPPLFSIEIGLLLVSIKIIWMLYKQTKVEHFQFWILNSIEYRINDISKRLQRIEKDITGKS